MKNALKSLTLLCCIVFLSSCVSKKQFQSLESQLADSQKEMEACEKDVVAYKEQLLALQQRYDRQSGDLQNSQATVKVRDQQLTDLRDQIEDVKRQRDIQLNRVEDLTALSTSANQNIGATLSQLEQKDKYIQLIQAAKSRTDSINLALAVNLKSVLQDGLEDEDVEIKVDKTVVYVNLSDKMLYTSGSANITDKADKVLGKIATIVQSRPDVEVMVEGYTDNVPIKNSCIQDNWDLSVKRATSVVRALQKNHNIDPNRLIAAGRGEYNTLADNSTAAGRATNRRTRIIILPKLDQFYDLLDPAQAAGNN